MSWWVYVVIIFAVVSVLGFLLLYFQVRTEQQEDKMELSKERIDDMVATFDVLVELAKDNEKLKEKILLVQDKLRYSPPLEDKATLEKEKQITSRISDLKLKLASAKIKGTYYGCERLLVEIELMLTERNSRVK